MYFPPAGGGGVQRPLKLAQYLPALGIETHVLPPADPKWVHRDPDLRVPTQAWIHRVRYLGPRARKPAEELRAAEGLERALVQAQVTARRLLLPDASVTWNLTAIPEAIADEVRGLGARGAVRVISNGCDFDDFAGLEYVPGKRFRITHAGSFFGKRDPRPFLQAFRDADLDAVVRFVGDFRSTDREWAETLGLGDRLELVPYAPRVESLRLQRDSEA